MISTGSESIGLSCHPDPLQIFVPLEIRVKIYEEFLCKIFQPNEHLFGMNLNMDLSMYLLLIDLVER